MGKLYLIDGMSVVFRAYHAMSRSGLKSPSGEPTFAVFAFANILTSMLEKEAPEHIVVAFDRKEPTFRHLRYPLYKANRDAFPEDLVPQLQRIKELIHLLGIRQIELAGFEADDIIGTLTTTASQHKIEVACLTSDKDYYQLVNDYVKLYKPSKNSDEDFDIVSYKEVHDKFGVTPDKVIDVLALIGDSSDNIPGVLGIGEKTAIPLIQRFGTVEGVYDNLDEIEKAVVKNKLIANREMAFLSKELVTIKTDVPLDMKIDELDWQTPDFKGLDTFFKEVNFGTLRKKWAEKGLKAGINVLDNSTVSNNIVTEQTEATFDEPETDKEKTISDTQHKYRLVNTIVQMNSMIAEISKAEILSVDLETSSLNKMDCNIVGIAISCKEDEAYYIAVNDDFADFEEKKSKEQTDSLFDFEENIAQDNIEIPFKEKLIGLTTVIPMIKPVFENPDIGKIGQNIKFDAFILKRYGISLSPLVFDSMIASYLLNPDEQHNLDALSKKWLNYLPVKITSLIGEKKSTQKSMRDVDPEEIAQYAGEDADLALKLTNLLRPEIDNAKLTKLADEIEFPLLEVLIKMELNGIAIDEKMLKQMSKDAVVQAEELTKKIYEEAGSEFNIDSPKQLSFILFEKMQIAPISKTKTGYSTDVSVLNILALTYPIADLLLQYRQIVKLKSTYIDALPRMVNSRTGRIHTTYNQTIASTGRLSSTDPNLQNIPIRTDLGKEIRKAFVPQGKDRIIMSADYSQIELRIMAAICNDSQLVESFKNGLDIHASTAAVLYDIPLEEVNSDMRRIAKTVNFGIMYGLGAFGLSQRLGLGRRESQEIIDNYFAKYPGIRQYIDETIHFTEKNGYAETMCGRRRFFPNITSKNRNLKQADERAAINLPIQGTASDMIKLGMIRVDKSMVKHGLKSKMMLQVHDELVFEAYLNEVEELKALVKYELENALSLGEVPVLVEIGTGDNWFAAH